MHRIDHATASPTLPTPAPVGTPGYFTEGNPLAAVAPTVVGADFLNALQEEALGVIEGMGLTPDKGNNGQLLEAVLKAAAQGSFGNLLTNPDFRIWNRYGPTRSGITFSRGYYGPDRWLFDSNGGTGNLTRTTLTGAQPLSYSGQLYACRWDTTAVAASSATVRQRVEGAHQYAGLPVVVAFDVRRRGGSDHNLLGVEIEQVFNSGPSTTVVLTNVGGNLIDTNWRRLVYVGTLPGVSGKDLIQAAHLELRVKWPVNTAIDVEFTAFTFARGSKDPGFFNRPESTERLACWRYYESTARENSSMAGVSSNGALHAAVWDTAFPFATFGGNAVGTLKAPFRVGKFTNSGAFGVRWYGLNGTAGFVTEKNGPDVHHAVTTSAAGQEGYNANTTGAPLFSGAPPAAGAKLFLAGWEAFAEITRAGDDATAP